MNNSIANLITVLAGAGTGLNNPAAGSPLPGQDQAFAAILEQLRQNALGGDQALPAGLDQLLADFADVEDLGLPGALPGELPGLDPLGLSELSADNVLPWLMQHPLAQVKLPDPSQLGEIDLDVDGELGVGGGQSEALGVLIALYNQYAQQQSGPGQAETGAAATVPGLERFAPGLLAAANGQQPGKALTDGQAGATPEAEAELELQPNWRNSEQQKPGLNGLNGQAEPAITSAEPELGAAGEHTSREAPAARFETQLNAAAASLQQAGASTSSAPAPAGAAQVQALFGSDAWSQDFEDQLVGMALRGERQISLHLNPRELGPLVVELTMVDKQAQLHFVTGHQNVRQAVEQALPQLREALDQQGIALGDANVSQQDRRDSQPGPEREFQRQAPAADEPLQPVERVAGNVQPLQRGLVNLYI
ncbi:hypothetical protein E4634_12795 [Mangrovimicrobium sediminis]|uniref:Flagellar hook-length control protein-like C-terminal domain-containing protein n=1 Tax=Mangrovimicrobium sediminis TaxID=2562682 RepID=A0A4Z0M1A4_9GAMM|nr:flagellar hook-length control protein FliK [Haliea sp. SAOS-164]TGD73148.1 hypothetical protein E4634_12795 [Haliea sp. SAOS-164]